MAAGLECVVGVAAGGLEVATGGLDGDAVEIPEVVEVASVVATRHLVDASYKSGKFLC